MNFDNSAKCDFSLFKDDESSNYGVESLRKTAAASWLSVPNLSLNHRSKGSVIFGGKHAHRTGRLREHQAASGEGNTLRRKENL